MVDLDAVLRNFTFMLSVVSNLTQKCVIQFRSQVVEELLRWPGCFNLAIILESHVQNHDSFWKPSSSSKSLSAACSISHHGTTPHEPCDWIYHCLFVYSFDFYFFAIQRKTRPTSFPDSTQTYGGGATLHHLRPSIHCPKGHPHPPPLAGWPTLWCGLQKTNANVTKLQREIYCRTIT